MLWTSWPNYNCHNARFYLSEAKESWWLVRFRASVLAGATNQQPKLKRGRNLLFWQSTSWQTKGVSVLFHCAKPDLFGTRTRPARLRLPNCLIKSKAACLSGPSRPPAFICLAVIEANSSRDARLPSPLIFAFDDLPSIFSLMDSRPSNLFALD